MELQAVVCNSSPIPFSWANRVVLKSVFAVFFDITPSRVACLVMGNCSTKEINKYSSYAKPSSLVGRRVVIRTRWNIPASLSFNRFQRFANLPVQIFPGIIPQCSYEQHKPRDGFRTQRFGSFSFTLAHTVLTGNYSINSGRRKCLYNPPETKI